MNRLCALALALLASTTQATDLASLRRDVYFLASSGLEGRRAGTVGAQVAADFIAQRFAHLGLAPAGDQQTYFQTFSFVADVQPGPGNALSFSGNLTRRAFPEEFAPLTFSASGTVEAEVVFAGYGIAAPELGYDDFQGLELKGKVALILRFSPAGDDPASPFAPYLPLRRKVSDAVAKGAAAVLIATGPASQQSGEPVKVPFDYSFADAGVPVMAISTALAEQLFAGQGFTLRELQERMDGRREPASRPLAVRAHITTDLRPERRPTANVVALLPGNDPNLGQEMVVVGAHYDHLGWGGPGSNSLVPDVRAIHNGADDNASGVAALLQIAQQLAARPPKRSVIFVAFSAEELGLLGSSYFVQHLPVAKERVVAMVNLDMVGRPKKGPALTLGGYGTAKEWPELVETLNRNHHLKIATSAGGFGASDHASFYNAGIPVLFFFTGAHEDYHKPSDDADKLDYPAMAKVVQFAADTVRAIAHLPQRPTYQKVAQEEGPRRSFKVRTGLIPEYGWEGRGVKVSGVRGGSAAEKAGLQAGDVVLQVGNRPVHNIYDYMYALGDHQAGETVPFTVLRGGERLTLSVTFEAGGGGKS
ncbi:MAG: M20/M25/M40 family metallo-hydrolase [Thermoanaerobaculum sp.]|nr:M20/M25/M40 family metallo-hydrolase [Thermoanaerobaculum sp.]